MPLVVATQLMTSLSQQSKANSTRTRSPLSQESSSPSAHHRVSLSFTATLPSCFLTQQQLQRVLEYTRTRRHYKRNRAIILLTQYAMLRVGEVAALRYCDVVDADGEIKAETTLSAAQTKGNKARKVWFAEKIRVELAAYVTAHKPKQLTQPLFYTQRSEGLLLTR
jgi:site-specific recombinase XerD